jgi:glycine cleavage system H protein
MGEFAAEFPADRMYADNHMWAQSAHSETTSSNPATYRFGFTAYAVRLLQDVYFLDWLVDAPAELKLRQEIGSIESKKAESALFAPIAGQLTTFNEELLSDPSAINVDKYGRGWLFELTGEQGNLLTAEQYVYLLESVWEKTQRTIKGQLNE